MATDSPNPHHVILIYEGHPISYREDGWFNATEAAAKFGKRPVDWLRLPETDNYLSALCRQLRSEKISLLKVIRGGRSHPDGTWLHPKLAVPFARWLNDATSPSGATFRLNVITLYEDAAA